MKNIKHKKNLLFSFVLSIFGCVLLAGIACFLGFRISLSSVDSVSEAKNVRVEIPNGSSVSKIGEILVSEGLIRSDRAFYIAVRFPVLLFRTKPPVLHSGYYNLSSSMSSVQIMNLLESGVQDYIKVLIPEGLTIKKVASILEKNNVCSEDEFIKACYSEPLLEKYKIPANSFEGFLFPDTYFLAPKMNAEKVLAVMVDSFFNEIDSIDYFKGKTPAQFYETLVLASIVEREYRVSEEAPLIASVFKNRIDAGVGLYSCATIEYIITEIQGKPHPDIITYDDLKIDSPYNTYKWAALPPSPISNPGLVALRASGNPPKTDYFYFTLTDSSVGSHTFSKSFDAHVKAGSTFRTKKSKIN